MDVVSVERNLNELASGVGSLEELARDLLALNAGDDRVDRWMSRPAVLRRVALLAAEGVPAVADRVVATGPGASVLATAVGLTTGLPFAVLEPGTSAPIAFGEVHRGERVSVVTALEQDLGAAEQAVAALGATVASRQGVIGNGAAALVRVENGVGA